MAFKIHRGICSCGCGKEGIVCVKKGWIQECNERIKKEKKNASPRMKPFPIDDPKHKTKVFKELKNKYQLKRTSLKRTALKKKFPKNSGQKDVFERIWSTREHRCEVCDAPVKRVDGGVRMFSHVVSKQAYPDLKLDEENILIKGDGLYGNCNHHQEWEHRTAEMREIEMWKPIFLLHDALIRKSNVTNKGKE